MSVGIGTWTLGVVIVAGAASLLVGWRRPFAVLSALVLLVPFRDFSTRWMNVHTELTVAQVTAIGRWWFAVIAALLALEGGRWAVRQWRGRAFPRLDRADLLLGLAVSVAAAATVISDDLSLAFTSLRGYLQPLGVYLLARLIRPSRRGLKLLLVGWLAVGLIMAAFALVQVAAWDEQTYRAEGYVRQDGSLVVPYAYLGGRPYLRPASTVSGPNELGMDMVLLVLLAGFAVFYAAAKWRTPLIGLTLLFTAGLAFSVSRSAALGFVTALAAAVLMLRQGLLSGFRRMEARARRRVVFLGLAMVSAAVAIFAGTGMLRFVAGTVANLRNTYHIVDSVEALQFLTQQPQGVGMGLVEPKGALSLIEAGGTYHVEGSLFQIAMEMGVWGLAIWLAFWGTTLARIWRNWGALDEPELRIVAGAATAGWIGSLAAFVFLPLMQSISLMVWLWFLLGIGREGGSIQRQWNLENLAHTKLPSG